MNTSLDTGTGLARYTPGCISELPNSTPTQLYYLKIIEYDNDCM